MKTRFFEDQVIKMAEKKAEESLVLAGEFIAGAAKLNSPYDTGYLRGSVTYATQKKRGNVASRTKRGDVISKPDDNLVCRVGTAVHYAAHQEFGTRFMSGQPFLRPALLDNQGAIKRIFRI